jgi:uncharacterized membrane protein
MTAVPPSPASNLQPTSFSRGMAFLGYFLLLGALPTLGSSALIALVLAYARRDGAAPLIRSHHRFQIRIFWIGLALTVAAVALGFSAWLSAGEPPTAPFHIPHSPDAQAVAYHPLSDEVGLQPAALYSWSYGFERGVGTRALMEGYAAMISIAMAGLWSIAAPLWGLVRLASGRPIGHSAR